MFEMGFDLRAVELTPRHHVVNFEALTHFDVRLQRRLEMSRLPFPSLPTRRLASSAFCTWNGGFGTKFSPGKYI